ncbi:MAG: hypothetical protein ACLFRA_08070, partial [Alphaproteobacteria bacterium]
VQRSFGDFNNAEDLQDFKDSEVGRAQIAMINEEMGECTLMPSQLDSLLWEAQLYQKSGVMEPHLTAVIEEEGFHFIDFESSAPSAPSASSESSAPPEPIEPRQNKIDVSTDEQDLVQLKREVEASMNNVMAQLIAEWEELQSRTTPPKTLHESLLRGLQGFSLEDVGLPVAEIATSFDSVFSMLDDRLAATWLGLGDMQKKFLWEFEGLNEGEITDLASKIHELGGSRGIANILEGAIMEGQGDKGPLAIISAHEGARPALREDINGYNSFADDYETGYDGASPTVPHGSDPEMPSGLPKADAPPEEDEPRSSGPEMPSGSTIPDAPPESTMMLRSTPSGMGS